jgi:hypothetical protein
MNVLFRKDQEKELLNFEAFLQDYFDLTNPIHQKLLKELYPNYFERRLDVIRESLTLQEKLARLKLFGPQTKEDIFFIYAIINGDIKIPDTLVFDLDKGTSTTTQFNRGFFNVKRWTTEANATPTRLGATPQVGLFGAAATPSSAPAIGLKVGGWSSAYAASRNQNPISSTNGLTKNVGSFKFGL